MITANKISAKSKTPVAKEAIISIPNGYTVDPGVRLTILNWRDYP